VIIHCWRIYHQCSLPGILSPTGIVCGVIITGPPNGPVLFCWLAFVVIVVVCNAAGGRAGRLPSTWTVGRPTLHGGPVVLRPVRATPCLADSCVEDKAHSSSSRVVFSVSLSTAALRLSGRRAAPLHSWTAS